MRDTAYTKEALLTRIPFNPRGWYATTFESALRKQMELRKDELLDRHFEYCAWYEKKHGCRYVPQTVEHVTKMPETGQFRFKDVAPKSWKELLAKLKKYRMSYEITDTIIRKGESFVTGYAYSTDN